MLPRLDSRLSRSRVDLSLEGGGGGGGGCMRGGEGRGGDWREGGREITKVV